jgi:hypothetical protein
MYSCNPASSQTCGGFHLNSKLHAWIVPDRTESKNFFSKHRTSLNIHSLGKKIFIFLIILNRPALVAWYPFRRFALFCGISVTFWHNGRGEFAVCFTYVSIILHQYSEYWIWPLFIFLQLPYWMVKNDLYARGFCGHNNKKHEFWYVHVLEMK